MRRIRIPCPPLLLRRFAISVLHCCEGYARLRLVSLLCDTWMTGRWGFCDTVMPANPAIAEIGLSSITYFDYYLCVTHWKSPRSTVFSSPNVSDNNKYCLRYFFANKNHYKLFQTHTHVHARTHAQKRVHNTSWFFLNFEKIDNIEINTVC